MALDFTLILLIYVFLLLLSNFIRRVSEDPESYTKSCKKRHLVRKKTSYEIFQIKFYIKKEKNEKIFIDFFLES